MTRRAGPADSAAPILPFAPGIYRAAGNAGDPVLLGGHCRDCDRCYFPRPARCPVCLGDTAEAEIGARGRIYSWTVVRTKPPLGLPAPYAVGYVDLDDSGLRVFALLDPVHIGALRIGAPVRLSVQALGHDGHGTPRLRPCYTPADAGHPV